ncbi:hypothetical protein PsorP6_008000 [Peronosclerospora sorghi]|uniref:Uncharacterized protein n=1 Tax=Peronosclerospora sorghi TaxID=230839 RepID=A0ACC0WCK1_9STRA|nr:hypothetical protein PsorP6_008000 [Peronosclerospora sorghi]
MRRWGIYDGQVTHVEFLSMLTRPVRVLSERIMSRGFEPTVIRLMENVQHVVRAQPGLISLETLSDVNDHHKYVVLSEWKSIKDYEAWTSSEAYRNCTEQINEVLDVPGKRTTIYEKPKEDIFLLALELREPTVTCSFASVKSMFRRHNDLSMNTGADTAASGPFCFSAALSPTSSISSTSSIDALLSHEDPTLLLPPSEEPPNRVIFSRSVMQVPLKDPMTNETVMLVLSQLEFDVMAVHVPQYQKVPVETLLERIAQLLKEHETKKQQQDLSASHHTVSDALSSPSLAAFQSRVLELEFEKKRLQAKLKDSKAQQVHLTHENAGIQVRVEQMEQQAADVKLLLQENERLRFQHVQLGENVAKWKALAVRTLHTLNALKHELQMVKQQVEYDRDEIILSVEEALAVVLDEVHGREQVLQSSYLAEKKERQAMAEKFYEVSGRIRVFCRLRPPSQETSHAPALVIPRPNNLLVPLSGKEFAFDQVFGPESTQAEVYAQIDPLILSFTDGYNACIMAYGQTGAGKTFTMVGSKQGFRADHIDASTLHSHAGVIPRALEHVFAIVKKRQISYVDTLKLSMVEIYNDQILDLLHEGSTGGGKNTVAKSEMDITARDVASYDQVDRVLRDGNANRNIAATKMNLESSRSHALFFLYLTSQHRTTREMRKSTLCLVDLAGSERIARSQVEGDRLRETQHINKSLAALGDVVYALQHKAKHTPYRNSKLTYLLRDMLSGQAKTLLMLQVSPDLSDTEETACSLQFGARVSQVQMGVVRPSVESGHLFKLQEENSAVNAKMMALESQLSDLQLQCQQREELSKALGERQRSSARGAAVLGTEDSTAPSRPRSPLKSSRCVMSSSSSGTAPSSAPSSLSRRSQVPSSTRLLGASLASNQTSSTRTVSRFGRPQSNEERQNSLVDDRIVDQTTRRKSLSATSASQTVDDGHRRKTLSALPTHLASQTRQTDFATTLSPMRQSPPVSRISKPRVAKGVARPASSSKLATGGKSTRTLHRTASTSSTRVVTSTRKTDSEADRSAVTSNTRMAASSTPTGFLRRTVGPSSKRK